MREGEIGRYEGVTFTRRGLMGGLAAAIAALTGVVGDRGGAAGAPGLTCAAFERLGYVPPETRWQPSDPEIVRQVRMEAIDKRMRKQRKRLENAWRASLGRAAHARRAP